jgi:hypothetical protein
VIDVIVFVFPYITYEGWRASVAPDWLDHRPGNTDMPKPKTVILWGQNDLLTKAMEMFLTTGETDKWEVISFPANQCISSLVEQVRRIKPDLVIIYHAKPDDDSDPLMKLFQEQPELRVIADQPESRVITVSLENNVMQVYSKHSITVRQASDLLSVIEDRYFSENPV